MFARAVNSSLAGARSESAPGPSSLEAEVTALFDQHRVPLLRYLLSLGLAVQDGEEVIQEVFLALFQHLRQNKPRTNLGGWVFRVAHNLGLKRGYAVRRESSAADHPERFDPALNPEQQAATLQRQKHLLSVVGALPEQDRRCLYLRAEGLRYREIMQVLGMSLGAVAQSLERSLARLSRSDQATHQAEPNAFGNGGAER
jgi:RNA polymerase sigma-70 factor (ECF subfamily)